MSEKLNRNVPKLRFPEFVVDWKKLTLISFVENIIDYRGKAPPKSEDGIILITARNVKQGFLDFSSKEFIPSEDYDSWMSRGLPQKGDILFTTEAPLGNVCMFPDSGVYALGQRTLTLRAKSGLSYGEFLFYILQSPKIRTEIFSKSTGSTAKGIKSSVFKKIPLQVPSVEEQKKIANFLGAIDTRLTQLRRKRELLQTYKRGVMQKIFSQEVRFKGAIGVAFPDWEETTLEKAAKYRRGSFPQPYGLEKWYDDNHGDPFVQVYDVDTNIQLKLSTKRKISREATPFSVFVKKGSIVLTIQGSIGRIAITQYDCYVDRTLLIFEKFLQPLNTLFFAHSIFLLFEIEKGKAPGGTIKTITKESLSSFSLVIPCIEEQEKIADFLTAIDQKIEAVARQVDRTEQFKKGLLQKMFV